MLQKPEIWHRLHSLFVAYWKCLRDAVWCITDHWRAFSAFLPATIYQRVQEFHNKNCDIGQRGIFGDSQLNLFQVGFLILENASTTSTQGRINQILRDDIIYQTRKTVFDHIPKHREESWKYDAQRSIFDELGGVWKWGQTLSWVFDMSSQSKLKLRRKRRIKIVKSYAN